MGQYLIRGLDYFLPGRAIRRRARQRKSLRHLAPAETGNDVDRRLRAFTGSDLVVPSAPLRGRARRHRHSLIVGKTKAIRMIAHDEKIERARQLYALTARSGDLLAFSEAVSILRRQPTAKRSRLSVARRLTLEERSQPNTT